MRTLIGLSVAAGLCAPGVSVLHAQAGSEQATALARVAAQTAAASLEVAPSQTCPVEFSAQRTSGSQLRQAAPSTADRPTLTYKFRFTSVKHGGMTQARVVLGGYTGSHVQRLGESVTSGSDQRQSAWEAKGSEPLTLLPTSAEKASYQSVGPVYRLTSVDWIDLKEVTYADGSTWHAENGTCRIWPNRLLPVIAAR